LSSTTKRSWMWPSSVYVTFAPALSKYARSSPS
jgi:hypothetical protein